LEIITAKTAGFCFGVNNAVNTVYELIDNSNKKIYTIGPIIHNEQVIDQLKSKGVEIVDSIEELKTEGDVVIRAHGISKGLYQAIKDKGFNTIDATCPYVKKIHNLVKEKHDEGYQIIIVGDRDHPEVKGINGWCDNSAIIVNDINEVDMLVPSEKKFCVVAQTTLISENWDNIYKKLKNKFKNLIKFDTICNATSKRQHEAAQIAREADLMLVVGSKSSSNTRKLFKICKNICPETYQVETAGDIPPVNIKKIKKVGITAGASTPDWVIKEVLGKMEELNKQENDMNFKEAFEESLVTLRSGEIVKGRVLGFNNNEVFIDMGYKSDGIIPMDEFSDVPGFKPEEDLKVGEEIDVFIVRVNDGEGNVLLSKKKVDAIKSWSELEEAYKNKTPVKARVVEVTKGGLISVFKGARIFIPASQVSDKFIKDLNSFLKQAIDVRIIEINKNKRKVVGSRRVLVEEEKKKLENELWDNIEEGKVYSGTVKSLTDFGAFVDIGGVDGLVHVSELSWTKIKHPSEVLKTGDKVEVNVLEFDREKKRISLGYRKIEDNPWFIASNKYNVGDIVKGKVVRLVPFGAFVELEKGVDGLVHISQISNVRIAKPGDVLHVGQEVEAKIVEMDTEAKKISMSIKEVNPIDPVLPEKEKEVSEESEENLPTEHKEDMSVTLGDIVESYKNSEYSNKKENAEEKQG
jgi:small subunit ribosomal protein S1